MIKTGIIKEVSITDGNVDYYIIQDGGEEFLVTPENIITDITTVSGVVGTEVTFDI